MDFVALLKSEGSIVRVELRGIDSTDPFQLIQGTGGVHLDAGSVVAIVPTEKLAGVNPVTHGGGK